MRVNRKRMIKNFMEMAKINSPSLKEKEMAAFLKHKFKKVSKEIFSDSAAKKTGGDAGNLIIRTPGDEKLRPFLLSAHMDTVGPFGKIRPLLLNDRITSDGKTILGADCKAGIAIILETVETLIENKAKIPPFEIVFTISEEMALLGAKNLDYSRIKSKYGLVFDNEQKFENVVVKSPAANSLDIRLYGKAAHSGVAPETGISAIAVISSAISGMKLGRIDEETTVNIGLISGGEAINIIPPSVQLKGEIRSHDPQKIEKEKNYLKACLLKAVKKSGIKIHGETHNPRFELSSDIKFPNFHIDEKDRLLLLIEKSMAEMGSKMKKSVSGGGTDANIFYGHRIITPILSTGMRNVHTTSEYLELKDFFRAAELTMKILTGLAQEKL